LYINESKPSFPELLNLVDTPLAHLQQDEIRPPKEALDEIMKSLM